MGNASLVNEFTNALMEGVLKRWYPLAIDREQGGYFTNITYDWKLPPEQEKMIVTQARHIWTLSKAAAFLEKENEYVDAAMHGYKFLKNFMWDKQHGGFYQIRSRNGGMSDVRMWRDEKRAYGCAFAIYGLAALARETRDTEVLNFAKEAYGWVEEHSYDPKAGGYFEFLTREGRPFDLHSPYKTKASDGNEVGFKDQNSSIHLLEAYTELYSVWRSPELRKQLEGLLVLIRDRMVAHEGYLRLFFHPDWTPVSFKDAEDKEREENFGLDHVSFGHDYETAFLMLEASHTLGIEGDMNTLSTAKRMLDHALMYGFDGSVGGFYDGGYYLAGGKKCTIVKETKNWWAQAEGLNALLLFSKIFPEEPRYYDYFLKQWNYVKTYILDPENGDWFEGGLDKEPHFKTGPKGHIWKGTYHTGRALMNCIDLLNEGTHSTSAREKEIVELAHFWRDNRTAHHPQ
ncbi:MAG TPA: AGE family epimerase/isomerase [Bacteroidota bacterium]|nr:AGE family epimerase/isomerase [Bacteroidota bacterium]